MRRRKQVLLTAVVVMLMMVVLPLNAMAKSKVVPNDKTGIPDKVLYQRILQELGKNRNRTFTEKEAARITRLEADGEDDNIESTKIKSLKGIEKLKNLTYLNVSFNRLRSIKHIKNLQNLKYLDVAVNQLTTLSGIEKLYQLESLDVSHNKLTSFSGLENLKNLKSISAWNNQIKNIDAIKNLVNLENIVLNGNRLKNLDAIKNLKKLTSLYAIGNRLNRLPNLNEYTELGIVEFKWNCLSEKELKEKLPQSWTRIDDWYKSTVKLQNIKRTIQLLQPVAFEKINKNTRKIVGKANKNSTVSLRSPNGKKIISVKSDSNGKFIFRNLNLEKWSGMTLILQSYVMDKFYGEKNILKEVKFTVRN